MPKLPRNMVRRKGRPGFYFRKMISGRVTWIALGADYVEACRKLRSLKIEGPPKAQITLRDAAVRWLDSYVPTARIPRDQKLARRRFEMYLEPFLGHCLLHRLTREDLRAYRLHLERTHLSVQSVRHILSDLRCMLRWCEDAGLLDLAPIPHKFLPRVQERPPDRLTDEEVERVNAVPDPYGFVCRLGIGTGLRWGELARATSADIQGGCLVVHRTKTGKVRRVPLTRALRDDLHLRVGRLLPFTDGTGFTRQVRKLSGVEQFHPNMMRHTFGCRWLENGGSLAALQEMMGHTSIVTTQRYARLADVHVKREAELMEGRLATKVVAKDG